MSDIRITLRRQDTGGRGLHTPSAAPMDDDAQTSTKRGAHRLVYLAIAFSIALGLLFASDSLVSYCYDLPQNAWTEPIVRLAEEWHREMENVGLTTAAGSVRDWIAAIRGG
jgi:hypothetical protein